MWPQLLAWQVRMRLEPCPWGTRNARLSPVLLFPSFLFQCVSTHSNVHLAVFHASVLFSMILPSNGVSSFYALLVPMQTCSSCVYHMCIHVHHGRNLGRNQLTGTIPASMGNFADLTYLYLSSNQLNGTTPTAIGNLTNLQILSLSFNQLSGTIPAEIGNLAKLNSLDLGCNQLTGTIPASMGTFADLTYLSLFFNKLSGTIPAEIGNLAKLNSLSLSVNQLSGTIPAAIAKLAKLIS
ncbi:unnamed protein product, partial [Closterium sp. NIES-53]